MSSFKGNDLFGSGPHRFSDPNEGQQMVLRLALGQSLAGSISLGDQEIVVIVKGRLVDDSDAKIDLALDTIRAELDDFTAGTLEDNHGRQWATMKFARFEPAERRDRGRLVSLAYVARFYRL